MCTGSLKLNLLTVFFTEANFTKCKIHHFKSVQFSGFWYIHGVVPLSPLRPAHARHPTGNPGALSSHSAFAPPPGPWAY